MGRTKAAVNFTLSFRTLEMIDEIRNMRKEKDQLAGLKRTKQEEHWLYGNSSIVDDILMKACPEYVMQLRKEIQTLKSAGKTIEKKEESNMDKVLRAALFDWSDAGAKKWKPLGGGDASGW